MLILICLNLHKSEYLPFTSNDIFFLACGVSCPLVTTLVTLYVLTLSDKKSCLNFTNVLTVAYQVFMQMLYNFLDVPSTIHQFLLFRCSLFSYILLRSVLFTNCSLITHHSYPTSLRGLQLYHCHHQCLCNSCFSVMQNTKPIIFQCVH